MPSGPPWARNVASMVSCGATVRREGSLGSVHCTGHAGGGAVRASVAGRSPYTAILTGTRWCTWLAKVGRMTLPSATVGGQNLAKLIGLSSDQIWRRVVASNAASAPVTLCHWPSAWGRQVQMMPSFAPLADRDVKPPGIPSVGPAREPFAVTAGVVVTRRVALS